PSKGANLPQVPGIRDNDRSNKHDPEQSEFGEELIVRAMESPAPLVQAALHRKLEAVLGHQHASVATPDPPDGGRREHPTRGCPIPLPLFLCPCRIIIRKDRLNSRPIL